MAPLIFGEDDSQLRFNVNIFSFIRCVGVALLFSGFLSKRIAPCVAVLLVVLGRRTVWETLMSPFCTGTPGDLFL